MNRICNSIGLTVLLLGLPLAGAMLAGHDAATYLEFPPRTHYVDHAPFSWPAFIGLALFILAVVAPFLIRVVKHRTTYQEPRAVRPFPWWGWAAVSLGLISWILAWTRFDWFAPLQRYTFTPPWIAYIVVVNALTFRRTGRSLLTHRTRWFLKLFPLSAAFWWFFEYLNRFVQNWYYTACDDFSGWQYFIAATLPFSTVLPAVLSTEEYISTNPRMTAGLENFLPVRFKHPRHAAFITLILSSAGLFFISWFPDRLFPLLWVAPLLLLISFRTLEFSSIPSCFRRAMRVQPQELSEPLFTSLQSGDWRRVYRFCLAALICGFFWEMWNMYSLSQWIYTVPYVSRFHLFEMPILGFSGYLPFGLECAVIAEWFLPQKASYEK